VPGPTLRLDLDLEDALGRRLEPDAVIVQEDRNLVVSAPPLLDLDRENELDAAYLAIVRHRPLPLGRYLLMRPREGRPYWTYQAVVHDLEVRPSCRPGDVRRSLLAIAADASWRGFSVLAMEPLGVWRSHGLSWEEHVEAVDTAMLELALQLERPLRLVLLLPGLEEIEEVSLMLRSLVLRKATRSLRTADGDAAVVEVRREDVSLHYRFVPGSLSGYLVSRVDRVA